VHAHVLAGGPGVPVTPPGTLIGACDSSNPGIACRLAWDLTHSARVAEETKVYFAGPAQPGHGRRGPGRCVRSAARPAGSQ
jgi:hypothetical protein